MRPYKVILAQLIGPALLAVTFLWTTDAAVARSVFAGGLISALSNSYFAVQAFRYQGAENAEKIVRSFLKGEIGKIAIAILLFALSFGFLEDLNVVALFSGFVFAHFIGVAATGRMINSSTATRPGRKGQAEQIGGIGGKKRSYGRGRR